MNLHDSIIVNGNYRKVLEVASITIHPWVYSYWIEGIGSNKGLFWPHYDFEYSINNLICMSQDGETLYSIDITGGCHYVVQSVSSFENSIEIIITPNPASKHILIDLKQNMRPSDLFIYNGSGILIKQIILNEAQCSIDISELYSGLYFLVVQIENNIYTQKLIKL